MGADTSGARTSSQGSYFSSLTPTSACSSSPPYSFFPSYTSSSSSSPISRTMSKKHVYDSSEGLVLKSLRGAVKMNPGIRLHEPSKVVYIRSPIPATPQATTVNRPHSNDTKKAVAVISGGGSGHEPAHAGYVGQGMLRAAVAGDIFASPSAKQILKAIEFASSSSFSVTTEPTQQNDVLAIINNYTGDILNFGLAIEKARIAFPDVNIASVVVADDISLLSHNSNPLVGPRGLAANILVCKILGALAAHGAELDVVKEYGDAVVSNLVSLGVGLEHCHVPGRTKDAASTLTMSECEIGLGLHNEPGVMKANLGSVHDNDSSQSAKEGTTLVDRMISMLLDSKEGLKTDCREDGVVLFVNNLGGMSQLEMGAVVEDVTSRLTLEKIKIRRVYCSSYMTSLNAPGFSISLINVRGFRRALNASSSSAPKHNLSESLENIELENLLDAPTDALCWVGARTSWNNENEHLSAEYHQTADNDSRSVGRSETTKRKISSSILEKCIRQACIHVLQVEKDLTEFDTIVGDGDCGETFAAGANAILSRLEKNTLPIDNNSYSSIIRDLADIIEDSMGGTIGALLGIFLNSLSVALDVANADESWREAVDNARRTLSGYTPAQIGDRTIMDALVPFCDTLRSGEPFVVAVQHAKEGAEKTRGMKANLGRATYSTSSSATTDDSTSGSSRELPPLPPDPGAWGISAILQGLLAGLVE